MKKIILLLGCILSSICAHADDIKATWGHESSAGVLINTGNAPTQTYDLQQKTSYDWVQNQILFQSTFLRTTSRGVESTYRWSLGLRYERSLDKKWGLFIAEKVEGDKYVGYLQRYNTDLGGRYTLLEDEKNLWKLESGYRFFTENRIDGSKLNSSFFRFFTEMERKWNEILSTKLWFEYLQNFSRWDDQFFNTEFSLNTKLTKVLSLKTGYLIRYRRLLPSGISKQTDSTLTLALVAKF